MKNTEITRKGFDYNMKCADKETRAFLRGKETLIRASNRRVQNELIETGEHLLEAKERVPHGLFTDWAEGALGYTSRHTLGFMQVAQTFSKSEFNSDLNLSQTALFALASPSVSNEARTEILGEIEAGTLENKVAPIKARITEIIAPIETDEARQLREIEEAQASATDEDEYDDSDPFADDDDTDAFSDKAEIEAPETPDNETLESRMKNAEVTHDTLNSAPVEDELSDADWLETLPLWRVLKNKGHKGIFLKNSLVAARAIQKPLKALATAAKKNIEFRADTPPMFDAAMIRAAQMPEPRDWQICAPCRGVGCQRCGYAGYDTTGAGISALRVENGEVAL